MIQFKEFTLDNGLRVVVHRDDSAQIAVLNLIYNVGSRDENEEVTGFAHLFEHLMFGGSKHIENFDVELQRVGGENNAFTSPDVTNYYITVPKDNLETAFWLESDRMLSLSFDAKVLEVQRKVVIEEFKQRYLNQPYGDVWLLLRPLAYKKHSYKWATIGKEIKHIEDATMSQVKSFFEQHYNPNNAVLVVGGNVELDEVKSLAQKYFGPIEKGIERDKKIPQEQKQTERRFLEVEKDVPQDALYMAFHMPAKTDPSYYAVDLLSDVLGRGESSRLYQKLVNDEKVFSELGAYVMGSFDPGLMVISGKVNKEFSLKEAESKVWGVIKGLLSDGLSKNELQKVKNQAASSHGFGQIDLLERCIALAYGAVMNKTNLVNEENEYFQSVTEGEVMLRAKEILAESNVSVLHYKSEKK